MKLLSFILSLTLTANAFCYPIWEDEPHFIHYKALCMESELYEMEMEIKGLQLENEDDEHLLEHIEMIRLMLGASAS